MSTVTRALLLGGLLAGGPLAVADISRERPPEVTLPPPARPETRKAPEGEIPRGQLLYENHCRGCHESVVHVRERRSARTLAALEGAVRRWVKAQGLGWDDEEIVEVTDFLNARYYKLTR
ncbi:hypothetical protein SVA_2203 [Sulfurifustis variabilis]|uniref:Cytochrome c n=1 Tax=Sulfurifustis variabilis TaxID=1675686 RepID=A0A1B4V5F0_9GAMM|nr:cytochrome c [Sulfurifustis variabilis]BAU48753.1 hypothetical protein SVA_2203 [Sulfurifustis variabilis]